MTELVCTNVTRMRC